MGHGKYGRVDPNNSCKWRCDFCSKVCNGGIYRLKQHLVGGFTTVTKCPYCPEHVRDELKKFMLAKEAAKATIQMMSPIHELDDHDGEEEPNGEPSRKNQRLKITYVHKAFASTRLGERRHRGPTSLRLASRHFKLRSVLNSFITMYMRCGSVGSSRKLFDEMPVKGLITWNAVISGYAQNGLAYDVLELYEKMKASGVCPDSVTLVSVLSSCAHLGAQKIGQEVERQIGTNGIVSNVFVSNALITMYARCGNLAKARAVFDIIPVKSLISWTAMIGCYGMHGMGETGLKLFDDMIKSGIRPDKAVFVMVLSACSHSGLTDKGLELFGAMKREYNLEPGPEHGSCVVDLLGRAGRLDEATEFIKSMHVEPDGAVWGALLGACKIHKNVDTAELAFAKVIECEPMNIGYYVLMSNIYSDANNQEGLRRIRLMMRERGFRKEPGYSYVEHKGRVHLFLVGDRSHEQTEEVYRMLDELETSVMEIAGNTENDRDEEVLNSRREHSERLAVAFGILNTSPGAEILVIKNLRVCKDCHVFIKMVSKIVDRRFVIRDASRFHYFKDGVCSCKDYW